MCCTALSLIHGITIRQTYKPKSISRTPPGLQSSSDIFFYLSSPRNMYFSLTLVLAALPFLTVAIPRYGPPASRGIAVPVARRGTSLKEVADASNLATRARNAVA